MVDFVHSPISDIAFFVIEIPVVIGGDLGGSSWGNVTLVADDLGKTR